MAWSAPRTDNHVLTENDIVDRVCLHLQAAGWDIVSRLTTMEQGHGIVARRDGNPATVLRIEAKGGTSSKEGTKRFGRPFSSSQVDVHVARALYAAIAMQVPATEHEEVRVALALPDTSSHLKQVQKVQHALLQLEIGVFWVGQGGTVRLEAPWTPT